MLARARAARHGAARSARLPAEPHGRLARSPARGARAAAARRRQHAPGRRARVPEGAHPGQGAAEADPAGLDRLRPQDRRGGGLHVRAAARGAGGAGHPGPGRRPPGLPVVDRYRRLQSTTCHASHSTARRPSSSGARPASAGRMAVGLAEAGANVVATGRRDELIDAVATEIEALGRQDAPPAGRRRRPRLAAGAARRGGRRHRPGRHPDQLRRPHHQVADHRRDRGRLARRARDQPARHAARLPGVRAAR